MTEDPFTPFAGSPAAFPVHALRRDAALLRCTERIAAWLLEAEPDCPWVVVEARARRLADTGAHHSARGALGAAAATWQTTHPAAAGDADGTRCVLAAATCCGTGPSS